MDYEDDNYSTDSSEARERDAKKAIVEIVEEEETIPVPGYTEDELNRMLLNIQQIATCHDLTEEDINESYTENATKWLMDVLETTLFVYFDQGYLCASAGCPTSPVTELTYFIRNEPMHVFTLDGFHDEVTFGQFQENVEETILYLMNIIYAPLILTDSRWDENVKMRLFNELHSFMAHLTDVNSKIGSMVILYVPNEGHELSVEEAVSDKALVKRYENVLIYWISQIRLCLNDMDNVMHDLACPSDEYDFWVYKFEVLSGIEQQICHKNIDHILSILRKSQSLFIVKFKTLCEELTKEIERSKSNARYLTLLIDPCLELEASEYPKDVPPKLPNIIYLIRVISLNSEYYNNKKNTERLFSHLSNEIINYCKSKVEISKILNGHPRFGIKICDMSIDCCLAYKLIFKRVLERLQTEDFRKTWLFDETQIFNQIDIFIQRLNDIMEICETIIVFGRCDETVTIPALTFGCYNATEFTMTCQDMEKKFENGLKAIKASSLMILNVHDKDWYQVMSTYKKLIRSLEEIVQNLLVNVFISINNVEEALDVLTTMHNFSKRKSLQAEYIHKVEQMWSMFEKEVVSLNKDITRLDKEHLGILPKFAGKSMILHIKMKKCERLMNLLTSAHYLPKVGAAEAKLKMYELTIENIRKKIEDYNNEWSSQINPQPLGYLSRFLINRSPTHGGLIECNIDRNVLPIFDEAKYFDFMEVPLPASLIQMNPKAGKIISIFNKVVSVILLHNKILCSLSDKERLLFKEHIKSMDKKLSPGMFRLTYSDELTDAYISECLKHLNELQHFVDIYKTINMVTVKSFEKISNGLIVDMNIKSIGTLSQFKQKFKESRNESILEISRVYRKIIEYIIVVYEGFENQLSSDIAEKWIKYIRKIDALAEYAMLNLAKNTLAGVFTLLNGKNDMKPEPIIAVDITLKNSLIEFEPRLESVTKTLLQIYPEIIKTIKLFPRLNEKFELPSSPNIRNFYEVVDEDKECQMFLIQIRQAIQDNLDKTSDYLETWNLFQPIWDIDIDRFMAMYLEKGMKLKDFESSMSKYFDVANQVMMQDTSVTISFLTYNCSKLKENVLDYISRWKKSYKQTLCSETLRKLEKHSETLITRINKLNEQPTCYTELEEALQLHEQSMKELKDREADMAVIKDFYGFLVKYDIEIPLTIRKNYEAMATDWSWYQSMLREVDGNLFSQKEQFKMGLMTTIKTLQDEVDEVDEKLERLSESTEIIVERAVKLSKLEKQIQDCQNLKRTLMSQIKLYDLPEIHIFVEPVHEKLRRLMTSVNAVVDWQTVKDDNINLSIKKVRFDLLEKLIASHVEKIWNAFELYHKNGWNFLSEAKEDVEFFKTNLPFYKSLTSRDLKPRHWIKIRKVTGKNFDEQAKEFSIKLIIEMRFSDYLLPIQDILYSASLESKVEENLKTIVKLWMTLKHELKFKDEEMTTKVVEECRIAFKEHASLMADVKTEQLADTSSGLINEWEVKQLFISELLVVIQENSENVFQADEDQASESRKTATCLRDILDDLHDILQKTALKTSAGKPQTRYRDQSKLMKVIGELLETLETII